MPSSQRHAVWIFLFSVVLLCCTSFAASAPTSSNAPKMPGIIEQARADEMSLNRTYTIEISPIRMARMEKFYNDQLSMLTALDFNQLSEDDRVDYLLLKNYTTSRLHQLMIQKKQVEEMRQLIPFAPTIEDLVDELRLKQRPDAEKTAAMLTEMVKQLAATQKELDPKSHDSKSESGEKPKIDRIVANRAARTTEELSESLARLVQRK